MNKLEKFLTILGIVCAGAGLTLIISEMLNNKSENVLLLGNILLGISPWLFFPFLKDKSNDFAPLLTKELDKLPTKVKINILIIVVLGITIISIYHALSFGLIIWGLYSSMFAVQLKSISIIIDFTKADGA